MQNSTFTNLQEETIADLVGVFKNQVQGFVNALEDQNKGTQTILQYHSREIERLQKNKSSSEAPTE